MLLGIARTADEGGLARLWVMDHFFGIGSAWGEPESPMLEGYTTIAYMGAVTRNPLPRRIVRVFTDVESHDHV